MDSTGNTLSQIAQYNSKQFHDWFRKQKIQIKCNNDDEDANAILSVIKQYNEGQVRTTRDLFRVMVPLSIRQRYMLRAIFELFGKFKDEFEVIENAKVILPFIDISIKDYHKWGHFDDYIDICVPKGEMDSHALPYLCNKFGPKEVVPIINYDRNSIIGLWHMCMDNRKAMIERFKYSFGDGSRFYIPFCGDAIYGIEVISNRPCHQVMTMDLVLVDKTGRHIIIDSLDRSNPLGTKRKFKRYSTFMNPIPLIVICNINNGHGSDNLYLRTYGDYENPTIYINYVYYNEEIRRQMADVCLLENIELSKATLNPIAQRPELSI